MSEGAQGAPVAFTVTDRARALFRLLDHDKGYDAAIQSDEALRAWVASIRAACDALEREMQ